MYRKTVYLLLTLVLVSCGKSKQKTQDKFDEFLEQYYQENLELYMLNATSIGDHRYNDSLPNYLSKGFKKKEKRYYSNYGRELSGFSDSKLTEEQLLSKKILRWEIDINLERIKYPKDLMPLDQMWSLHLIMGQLGSGRSYQPFETIKDYWNWHSRLGDFREWLLTAKSNMKEGIERGIVLPKSLIVKVLPQLKQLSDGSLNTNVFNQSYFNFPENIEKTDQYDIGFAFATKIIDTLNPIIDDLHEFMSTEYLEAGRESSGYGDLPAEMDGYYEYAIKHYTTTNLSPDEIHQLGLDEVARIRAEMEIVKEQVGFTGTLNEFFDHVRDLEELKPFDDPQQVIDNFNAIHQKLIPYVDKLFDKKPTIPFEVRRVEEFREASASAHYIPGTPDGSRSGIFYVPIPDVDNYNNFSDESLFLHEAIPGHHFQISLAQENEELPSFRRDITWYSVYGEGWALYCESLGRELGLYTDPYQYFGMLSAEMHRAIRLVVDTGLHHKGWTREEAIEYSLENEAESEEAIISEIERYMANPGQALSYKIGQIKIRELRTKAEEILGDDFDIREFHNEILESGAIPLGLLEEKIENWIALESGSETEI